MTDWLTASDIKLPAKPPATSWVEWNMAENFLSDAENAELKFLAASPDPAYANPGAYIKSKMVYAEGLEVAATSPQAKFLEQAGFPYMPAGWDPDTAAIQACIAFFQTLQKMPVNLGDEKTNNIFDAWVNGLSKYYGGHLPAAPVTTQSSGNNPGTGPASVPAGTIFGGSGPQK